jgi:hypothetical protein
VGITHLPKKHRAILCIDNKLLVAVLLCAQGRGKLGSLHWDIRPRVHERGYITLVGLFNRDHDAVVSYHLFSHLPVRYRCSENDPWLQTGLELAKFSDFYSLAAKVLAQAKSVQIPTCADSGDRAID